MQRRCEIILAAMMLLKWFPTDQCFNLPPYCQNQPISPPPNENQCPSDYYRWYYDVLQKRCTQFMGKCPQTQTDNNFEYFDECQKRCEYQELGPVYPQRESGCFQKMRPEECQVFSHSSFREIWFFNITTGTCERCLFSGRKNFENRFTDRTSCMRTCRNVPATWKVRSCFVCTGRDTICESAPTFGEDSTCKCKPGFRRSFNLHDCEDIDECPDPDLNTCPGGIGCVNSPGTFLCPSFPGGPLVPPPGSAPIPAPWPSITPPLLPPFPTPPFFPSPTPPPLLPPFWPPPYPGPYSPKPPYYHPTPGYPPYISTYNPPYYPGKYKSIHKQPYYPSYTPYPPYSPSYFPPPYFTPKPPKVVLPVTPPPYKPPKPYPFTPAPFYPVPFTPKPPKYPIMTPPPYYPTQPYIPYTPKPPKYPMVTPPPYYPPQPYPPFTPKPPKPYYPPQPFIPYTPKPMGTPPPFYPSQPYIPYAPKPPQPPPYFPQQPYIPYTPVPPKYPVATPPPFRPWTTQYPYWSTHYPYHWSTKQPSIYGTGMVDRRECEWRNMQCDHNAHCLRVGETFYCKCNDGFTGDGFRCSPMTRQTTPVDPYLCEGYLRRRCSPDAECIFHWPNQYSCQCRHGYYGDGLYCYRSGGPSVTPTPDIKNCQYKRCDPYAVCKQAPNSAYCECMPGFAGNGEMCTQDRSACQDQFDERYRNQCGEYNFQKWFYFDRYSQQCKMFWYGTCVQGIFSKNIFSDEQTCVVMCNAAPTKGGGWTPGYPQQPHYPYFTPAPPPLYPYQPQYPQVKYPYATPVPPVYPYPTPYPQPKYPYQTPFPPRYPYPTPVPPPHYPYSPTQYSQPKYPYPTPTQPRYPYPTPYPQPKYPYQTPVPPRYPYPTPYPVIPSKWPVPPIPPQQPFWPAPTVPPRWPMYPSQWPTPPPTMCTQPCQPGSCGQVSIMFYFNPNVGQCQPFVYTGCGGNENKFSSLAFCQVTCQAGQMGHGSTTNQMCLMRLDQGYGSGNKQCDSQAGYRYYFNFQTGACEPFMYYGCGGNSNRFANEAECFRTCRSGGSGGGFFTPPPYLPAPYQFKQYEPSTTTNCVDPPDMGPCRNLVHKWFFDVRTGQCDQFTYGGCYGNGNRYETQSHCETMCRGMDPCNLPKAVGTCNQSHQRYYNDPVTRDCYPFTYSGCGGNANKFYTYHECRSRCADRKAK